jgi:hypothetical protein
MCRIGALMDRDVKILKNLDGQTGFTRDLFAKRIVETAAAGERNEHFLCDDALAHLTETALQKIRPTHGQ